MNLTKEAIENAQAKDKNAYTVEKIAEACAISPSALSNYKSGYRVTPPDVIVALSSYLHDLGLRDRYCSQECPIGRCKNPNGYTDRDMQTLGFMSGKSIEQMESVFKSIYTIYADGQRTRQEEIMFKENSLPSIYVMIEVLQGLANIGESF